MPRQWFALSILGLGLLLTGCPGPTPSNISGTVSVGTGNLGADSPEFVAGEVIVRFKESLGVQSVQRLQLGGVALQQVESLGVPNTGLYRAPVDAAQTLQVVAELAARPDVLYAHPNYILKALKNPNDEFFSLQWDLVAIKAPEAWDIEDGSSNPVTVGVIDTGILGQHPDFAGKIVPGFDFISSIQISNDGDGRDSNPEDPGDTPGGQGSYHGSHVAGSIAAATNTTTPQSPGIAGVSWGAKILPLRVLGVGGGATSDIIAAMYYGAGISKSGIPTNPTPAQVLNLSLGGPGTCSTAQAYQDAINEILAKGVTVVVAAGNSNKDASTFVPASCSGVITVGATDLNTKRARYSNFGPRIDVMAPGGDTSIPFGGQAQGGGILAPIRNDTNKNFVWGFKNGTSMAAPHVAGLLALMKSKKPSLTPSEALDILRRTAVPLAAGACTVTQGATTTGGNGDCGAGLINALAAIQALNTPTPTPDFSLSLSPNSLEATSGQNRTVTVNINRLGGFTGAVNLSFVGVSGITGSFSQTSVTGNSTTLTVSIGNVTPQSYALSVQGTSGAITRTADLTVNVTTGGGNTINLQNTVVFACYYTGVSCDTTKTKELQLTSTQQSAPYSFANLEQGNYYILAWKDVNANDDVDNGDYIGGYFENGNLALIKPPRSGANFTIELTQSLSEEKARGLLEGLR